MQLAADHLVLIADAAPLIPGSPSLATMRRWYLDGVLSDRGDRVRLQVRRIGGRVFVSRAAIDAFVSALNDGGSRG